ncbi:MAG: PfaB family protein [Desulforhopalus sp.]|jgi:PfaB family protein
MHTVTVEKNNTTLAIIGLDAQLDGCDNIDRVERVFYQGDLLPGSGQLAREFDFSSLCEASVQRVLGANNLAPEEVALIILTDTNEDMSGAEKAYSSCCTKTDLADVLRHADKLITSQEIPVLIVAAHLQAQGTAETGKATISFDQNFSGYGAINGVVTLLLSSTNFATRHKSYIYANIKSFAAGSNIEQAVQTALSDASLTAKQITALEVSALADPAESSRESNALLKAYGSDKRLDTAISSARSVAGECGPLSVLLGLLNSVFALQQRYISAIKEWSQPMADDYDKWLESPFYVATDPRPVFPLQNGEVHRSGYSCLSANSYTHLILEENGDNEYRANGFNASGDLSLFIIPAGSQEQLFSQLDRLLGMQQLSVKAVASQLYAEFQSSGTTNYRLVLLAESWPELVKEIELAQIGIPKAFTDTIDWKTPGGSYLAVDCVPSEGSVAFLYPGIGATYVGLGRELFHLFPEIYSYVATLGDDIGGSLKETQLYPRSITRLGFKELKQLDLKFRNTLADIAECGVGFACVFTKIFEQVFKVKADFSAGYSMGEISMYAALGCWLKPGTMSARLAGSDTFNHRLSGELRTPRAHWGLPDVADGTFEQIWETYNIKATLAEVEAACGAEDRVYCTIINTPDSLLLGGYPEDCLRVIKKIGVRPMALNIPNAIHCEPALKEYDNLVALYTMDVNERIATKMYSSSCYLPVPQMKKAIAVSVAKCLCAPVDFPRLIRTLFNNGARVFVEMGPGRALCSWLEKTLSDSQAKAQHVSVPVNSKGTNDQLTYARASAKLVSHGVAVNLQSFFHGSMIVQVK